MLRLILIQFFLLFSFCLFSQSIDGYEFHHDFDVIHPFTIEERPRKRPFEGLFIRYKVFRNGFTTYKIGDSWILMDTIGNTYPEFTSCRPIYKVGNFFTVANVGREKRLINYRGKEAPSKRYIHYEQFSNDFIQTSSSLRRGLLDFDGNEVLPPMFSKIVFANEHYFIGEMFDKSLKILNRNLEEIVLDTTQLDWYKIKDEILILKKKKEYDLYGLANIGLPKRLNPIPLKRHPEIRFPFLVVNYGGEYIFCEYKDGEFRELLSSKEKIYPHISFPNIVLGNNKRHILYKYKEGELEELFTAEQILLLSSGFEYTPFKQDEKFGLINSKFQIVLDPIYKYLTRSNADKNKSADELHFFFAVDTLGEKRIVVDQYGKEYLTDLKFKILSEDIVSNLVLFHDSLKNIGAINLKNEIIYPLKYSWIEGNKEVPEFFLLVLDDKYGYGDSKGNIFIEVVYDYVDDSFLHEIGAVILKKNKKLGLFRPTGEELLPIDFSKIEVDRFGFIWVEKEGKTALLKLKEK